MLLLLRFYMKSTSVSLKSHKICYFDNFASLKLDFSDFLHFVIAATYWKSKFRASKIVKMAVFQDSRFCFSWFDVKSGWQKNGQFSTLCYSTFTKYFVAMTHFSTIFNDVKTFSWNQFVLIIVSILLNYSQMISRNIFKILAISTLYLEDEDDEDYHLAGDWWNTWGLIFTFRPVKHLEPKLTFRPVEHLATKFMF